MTAQPVRTVGIAGLGLIGGSVAKAAAAAGYDVVATNRGSESAALAARDGVRILPEVAALAEEADLVVVATPMAVMPAMFADLAAGSATITDVGSVKSPVLAMARDQGLGSRFVGGHPMAGTEHAGYAAADPGLFGGASWVLTVEPDTDVDRYVTLARFVLALGARVVPVDAAAHDDAVAWISHLPHVFAAVLAGAMDDAGAALPAALAAGSFRDATRVMGSDPRLVAQMCGLNATALRGALAAAREQLAALDAALEGDDLVEQFTVARRGRARVVEPTVRQGTERLPSGGDELRAWLRELGAGGGMILSLDPDAGAAEVLRPV